MDEILKRLVVLEQFMEDMGYSNAIPRDVQTALEERLGTLNATGTGSPASQTSAMAFPVTVPANPSKTLLISYQGATYEVLCK